MAESPLDVRGATDEDIPALAELWAEAFPGVRSSDERMRELREGMPYGKLEDCRLIEVDGRVAAALRAYRLETHFRGRRYPTLGLAGVAVAPDFRRRGLGRRICVAALREAQGRGSVLSLLFPFRASFYDSLGYTLAGELHQYRFRTAELPLYPGWDRVERGSDAGSGEVRQLYARVAARSNGMLERRPGHWRTLRTPGSDLYLYRDEAGDARGYVVVLRGRRMNRSLLRVREMVWEDEASYRGLLGWISAQRDQYVHAVYDALPSEDFHLHLPHPKRDGSGRPRGLWFESARVLRGPMLRVLDVGGVLGGHAAVDLSVTDPDVPENTGLWRGATRTGASAPAGTPAMTIREVGQRLLAGTLPGQAPPPAKWAPVTGIHDFRLLDEF